ncbi:hypothetical protein JCM11491_006788 [Sporobolomyces phaffii]
MSFGQLPNETLQLIVDKCDQADQAYNARQDIADDASRSAGWRGRSCSAMSMVNKTLRSMASKYVFKTLYASKAQHDTFQYFILGSPNGENISRVVIDSSTSLFPLFLQILPRLPNLRSIHGLQSTHVAALVGPNGLRYQGTFEVDRDPRKTLARKTLLGLVHKVTDWRVELDQEDFGDLVAAHPSGVQHLELSSPRIDGFPIFGSSDSRFPSILARLSNLRTLVIKSSEYDVDGDDGGEATLIVKSVLKVPFSFVPSLRNLHLEVTCEAYTNVANDLAFAALFPCLNRLRLDLIGRETETDRTFILPKLEHLELRDTYFDNIDSVFISLELPSIKEVHFNGIGGAGGCDYFRARNFVQSLERFRATLRTVTVSSTSDLALAIPKLFHDALPNVTFRLDFEALLDLDLDPTLARKATMRSVAALNSRVPSPADATQAAPEPSPPFPLLADPIYEKTSEILEWTRGQAELAKGRDYEGGKELLRAMEAIEELKAWKED